MIDAKLGGKQDRFKTGATCAPGEKNGVNGDHRHWGHWLHEPMHDNGI